jgi:O-antigen/teichoic acid export membrane protein
MIVVWIIRITPHNLVFSLELFKRVLRFGLAAYPSTLADYALYRMDTYMIGYLLGFQSLGYYSIAVPLAELVWYLTAAIRPVLFARTAHAVAEEANVVTPTTLRGVLAIALILAGLIFSGGYLIVHLFIPAFTPALPVLAILLAATVIALIFQLVLADLTSRGHGASASRIGIASLCCGILFYLVLIPRLGIMGAAMASFLSYFLQSALSLLWFWKLTGLSPWQVLAPRQSDLVLVSDFVGRLARRVS